MNSQQIWNTKRRVEQDVLKNRARFICFIIRSGIFINVRLSSLLRHILHRLTICILLVVYNIASIASGLDKINWFNNQIKHCWSATVRCHTQHNLRWISSLLIDERRKCKHLINGKLDRFGSGDGYLYEKIRLCYKIIQKSWFIKTKLIQKINKNLSSDFVWWVD